MSGHSLGEAMASSYLNSHYTEYKGLILLASYSTTNLSTLSILASNDKVINMDKYNSNKSKLPNLTEYNIEGGIHSYFEDYGIMSNDGVPSIDVDTQTHIVKDKILKFVK